MSEQEPTHDDHPRDGDPEPLFTERQKRFLVLELVTEVRTDGLYVRLHPVQREPRHIPLSAISEFEATRYSPSEHFGWHWGLRVSAGGKRVVYRLSGDAGVLLHLDDDRRVFVGSQRADELERAIATARDEKE